MGHEVTSTLGYRDNRTLGQWVGLGCPPPATGRARTTRVVYMLGPDAVFEILLSSILLLPFVFWIFFFEVIFIIEVLSFFDVIYILEVV